ncbi:MAG: alpha/beta hydrolase [Anaerolineales bacterium]
MKIELITRKPADKQKATPLLFVHGKWHGAWCWDEYFLPYFASHGYDCTALSLRGHAGSEGREGLRWYSVADYVSDVEQVAERFETPPAIIGHSMGGFITQKYLEKHPETPGAVLLTAIPPSGLWPTTFKILLEKPLTILKVLATLSLYPTIETTALARWALFSKNMPDETVEAYRSKMNDESFRSYIDELGLNLVRPKRVKTPVLVVGAQNDNVIFPTMVQATARAYNTQAVIFPDMAHDVMLEAGWEKVAKRILDWLSEKGL